MHSRWYSDEPGIASKPSWFTPVWGLRLPGEHDRQVSEDSANEVVLEQDEETICPVMEALERLESGAYGVCQECGGGNWLRTFGRVALHTPTVFGASERSKQAEDSEGRSTVLYAVASAGRHCGSHKPEPGGLASA